MAGFADGTFVALADNLIAFDKQGHRLWTVASETFSGKPEKLVHPAALAVTTNEEILALENSEPLVKCFDRGGTFLPPVNVRSALNDGFNVLTSLAADLNGGFLIEHGKFPLARVTSDGSLRATLSPKYADGRNLDIRHDARIGPDGKIWTTDGYCLVRLSDGDDAVDRVVGGVSP